MKKLIVNADDFGLSLGVNQGIIEAHRNGIVTSTTVMVNLPLACKVVEEAKANPSLGVGIHLNVTYGRPLSVLDKVPSLTDGQGNFLRPEHLEAANPKEVAREWEAQVGQFLSWGIRPSHLDSHHHLHSYPQFRKIAADLARRLGVPVRFRDKNTKKLLKQYTVKTTDHFVENFYGSGATSEHLQSIIRQLAPETTEIMCHPAFLEEELAQITSYYQERNLELKTLMAAEVKELLAQLNIKMINYRDL